MEAETSDNVETVKSLSRRGAVGREESCHVVHRVRKKKGTEQEAET